MTAAYIGSRFIKLLVMRRVLINSSECHPSANLLVRLPEPHPRILNSNVVVNLRMRTEAARLAGVDGHVCELQLTPRIFAEAAVNHAFKAPHIACAQ
jgi:hypothetical protein